MRIGFDFEWLLALAVILPIAVTFLLVGGVRRRLARLARLGHRELVARLVPASVVRPATGRALRLGFAAAFAGVALAGPRWGNERTVVSGEGLDIVLAVDASLSMMATDERPNRLERAKQEIRRLRALSSGDRFALLAFAGRSYILTPLTVDDGALDLFLDNLDPSIVGLAGSSVARAIRQGTDLLVSAQTAGDKALIVMTDGEAFEPLADVEEAARAAAAAEISLVTVGFGTPQGSTIPVREGNTMVEKRDAEGNIVVTKFVPDLLRAAATAGNGTFIDAAETDKATRIRRAIQNLQGEQRRVENSRSMTPRFQLFLIPALLLLLLDTWLAERRVRRPSAAAAASTAAGLLLLLLPFGALRADDVRDAQRAYNAKRYREAAALYRRAIEQGDKRPEVLYNYGTALLAMDSLRAAIEVLERAVKADTGELRFRATFNLGLAHLMRGLADQSDSAQQSLDAALATYKRALLMRAQDGDAKWNYELALRKKQQGGGGGGGGGGGESSSANRPQPQSPQDPQAQRPSGGLGQQQAEQLLNSAAREERSVQGRRQQQNRPQPPPGGKDW